ncbi:MAG: alpha/beta hydrolase [Ktedonobacteraceae bacterium]
MPLDPQARAFLDQLAALPPWYEVPLELARQQRVLAAPVLNGPSEAVRRVEDRAIPGPGGTLPVRIYTPDGDGLFPVLVYFHGGGWVLSNLETHDALCRKLTNRAHCIVVSVDYRLAPEHKFPAAVDDSYAATKWVAENAHTFNGDATRIAVGGDSAGGNLATVTALLARERGGPALTFQLLIYPATDHFRSSAQRASFIENSEGYFLTRDGMRQFVSYYLPNPDEDTDFRFSPLQARDLSGLPPALVITAEYDPLRDEGEDYARHLQQAGVPVTLKRYDGMIHGFFTMAGVIDYGNKAIDETGAILRQAFESRQR